MEASPSGPDGWMVRPDTCHNSTRALVRYVGRAWGQWGQKYPLERETGFEGRQNSLCSQVRDVSGVLAVGGGHDAT
jgi:hypothetical protein